MIDTKIANIEKTQIGFKIGPYWEFTRPHTIIGTTITVLTLFLITVGNINTISQYDFMILVLTLMSSLLANIFIVGINQIYDIEIDKINKPYLPLASGLLSIKEATIIIFLSGFFSIIIAILVNIWLFVVVILGMGIGTFYSIPKTRYKTNPAIAAFSISFVRGVLGNIGLYLAYSEALSSTSDIFPVIVFLTIYVLIFSTVIALFKDIPDLEGDKMYNIMTFTVKMGREKIFKVSIFILILNYFLAILAGIIISDLWNQTLVVLFHALIVVSFYNNSRKVDFTDKISLWKFYKRIWQFFYLEYLILIVVVLL